MSDFEIKKKLLKICKKLKNLKILPGTSGNLSVIKNDTIFITPSGINKEELEPTDISQITINGHLIKGPKQSSEYMLHTHIYSKRKDVKAIIHTHPPYTLAYSITGLKPDYDITVEFKMAVGKLEFCPFITPGTQELAQKAAEKLKDSNVLVLRNHGLVCVSDSLEKAAEMTEEVENFFKINFLVSILKQIKR